MPMPISKIKKVSAISVESFFQKNQHSLGLSLCNTPNGLQRQIAEPTINRPGLALSGFYAYFAAKRVQVFGAAENAYLQALSSDTRCERFAKICEHGVPCVVFARDSEPSADIIEVANQYNICVFSSNMVTMNFINLATIKMEAAFAQSTTVHGCMVDIRGIGILIRGKSGVGKSETAIGLIERGGCLVADDIVRIKNIGGELITSAPELARGFMEVRGLGIVNVTNLFGLSSLRLEKRLDLIITLKPAIDLNNVDRLGLERSTIDVLGVDVPHIELPVGAGRDISRLIEVAAIDQQLKTLGYDMANEFNQRLMAKMQQ